VAAGEREQVNKEHQPYRTIGRKKKREIGHVRFPPLGRQQTLAQHGYLVLQHKRAET
jgi:hypothetical protein